MPLSNPFIWASRLLERAGRAFAFAAAGTMRLAELKQDIERNWDLYAIEGRDVDDGLMPWEQDLVSRFVRPSDQVLLVGAGAGRDLLPLLALGCRVTALEPSRGAVAKLERVVAERGLNAPVIHAFFEDAELSGNFDVIIFSYYCYSYIPVAARRVAVLHKAVRHLKPGGRVILSCPQDTRALDHRYGTLGRWAGALTRSDWRMERGDILWRDPNSDAVGYTHAFQAGELEGEVATAGLKVIYHNPKGAAFVLTA